MPGSGGGPGRQTVARSIAIRLLQQENASDDEIRAVMNKLLGMALKGDVKAANEWLNRICGKSIVVDIIEGDVHKPYPVLVTTTAEALKRFKPREVWAMIPTVGESRFHAAMPTSSTTGRPASYVGEPTNRMPVSAVTRSWQYLHPLFGKRGDHLFKLFQPGAQFSNLGSATDPSGSASSP